MPETNDKFEDTVAEAQDFLSEACQRRADGDRDEAAVSVLAAVITLEQILSLPASETG